MRYLDINSISNLSFISKATEKVVPVRLIYHLEDSSLHEIFQSAYKKGHSTETALTRIHSDIKFYVPLKMESVLYWCY